MAQGRPYTTKELYEQTKAILRVVLEELGYPKEGNFGDNFVIICPRCKFPFRNDTEIGMLGEHVQMEHDVNVDAGEMEVELVWIGKGDPPKGR